MKSCDVIRCEPWPQSLVRAKSPKNFRNKKRKKSVASSLGDLLASSLCQPLFRAPIVQFFRCVAWPTVLPIAEKKQKYKKSEKRRGSRPWPPAFTSHSLGP